MPFTDNQGVRIHWLEEGEGSPVLLIMGHRYSSAMWYPILPALTGRHRVIWFDNRGTGESDTTRRVTVQGLVADALAVMDAAGVERAHIFGVSMGGGLALELAMEQPARAKSLVLGCTAILTADKPRMPAVFRILYYLPPWALRLVMGRPEKGYGSAAPPDKIAADLAVLAKERSTVRGVLAQAVAVGGYTTTKEAAAKLAMPALVLHGDEDAVVPFKWGEEIAQTLPTARFLALKGAGHNFFIAAGDEASHAILEFLSEVDHDSGRATPPTLSASVSPE